MNDKKEFSLKDLFTEIPPEFSGMFENTSEIRPWYILGDIMKKRIEDFVLANVDIARTSDNFRKIYDNKVNAEGEVWVHHTAIIEPWVIIKGPVIIGKNVKIRSFSYIEGPTSIGENTEIRPHANIRGYVATGSNCVIGHTTEVIRSLLFNNVRADHFNYIGDSILGNGVHLGAHATIANLKLNEKSVMIKHGLEGGLVFETGLKKFGGILGDNCQLGCNSVIGPGVILTPQTWYYLQSPTEGIFSKEDFKKN